jgi:hypothetical protein
MTMIGFFECIQREFVECPIEDFREAQRTTLPDSKKDVFCMHPPIFFNATEKQHARERFIGKY